jgi:hypothetical protein
MPRVDLFTAIHKGVRALIYDHGLRLQTADLGGPDAAGTLAALAHALELLHEHGGHEEHFIFPPLRRFEPDLVAEMLETHRGIEARITAVRGAAEHVRAASAVDARAEAGDELGRRFNELAAAYLSHVAREEVTVLPATRRHFGDEELMAMRAAIIQSQPPEQYEEWLRWMLPALNPAELTGMLAGAKATVPPPVFEEMTAVARAALGDERWRQVAEAAGL